MTNVSVVIIGLGSLVLWLWVPFYQAVTLYHYCKQLRNYNSNNQKQFHGRNRLKWVQNSTKILQALSTTTIICFTILIFYFYLVSLAAVIAWSVGVTEEDMHATDTMLWSFSIFIAIAGTTGATTLRLLHVFQLKISFNGSSFAINNKIIKLLIVLAIVSFFLALGGIFFAVVLYLAWEERAENHINAASVLFAIAILIQSLIDICVCYLFNKNLLTLAIMQRRSVHTNAIKKTKTSNTRTNKTTNTNTNTNTNTSTNTNTNTNTSTRSNLNLGSNIKLSTSSNSIGSQSPSGNGNSAAIANASLSDLRAISPSEKESIDSNNDNSGGIIVSSGSFFSQINDGIKSARIALEKVDFSERQQKLLQTTTKQTVLTGYATILSIALSFAFLYVQQAQVFFMWMLMTFCAIMSLTVWLSFIFADANYHKHCKHCHKCAFNVCETVASYKMNTIQRKTTQQLENMQKEMEMQEYDATIDVDQDINTGDNGTQSNIVLSVPQGTLTQQQNVAVVVESD